MSLIYEADLFGPCRLNAGSPGGSRGHNEDNVGTIWQCLQRAYVRALRQKTVNGARDAIAASLGCFSDEWIFTGGGTESDNLALFGAAHSRKGGHIITTAIEHHAVLHACQELEKEGYSLTYLPVDGTGRVALEDLEAALRDDTFLISIMLANNEVGTVQPIEEMGRLARKRGILFHVDAVQALGSVPISLSDLPVDYMSFTAHKINGPQGIGGLLCPARRAASSPAARGLAGTGAPGGDGESGRCGRICQGG